MVVHHIEVDNIRAGSDDIGNLFAELGEIGGKNARCDFVHGDAFNKFEFESIRPSPSATTRRYAPRSAKPVRQQKGIQLRAKKVAAAHRIAFVPYVAYPSTIKLP
ncbi:MAG: hypothetical protein DID89_2727546027 [Candidatus Nitrotoga sp. CP45]|nr:MAG: hypothetical protein DID89_2727546027 [Candidatus Nitrotoga sp. CP45]